MLPARGIGGRPTKGGESAAARSSGRRQWWTGTGARVWGRSKWRRRGRASGLGADKDARNEVRRWRRPTRDTGNEDGRRVDSRDACIARRSRGAADRPGLHPDCPAGVVTTLPPLKKISSRDLVKQEGKDKTQTRLRPYSPRQNKNLKEDVQRQG
jgi:hypothetical protein